MKPFSVFAYATLATLGLVLVLTSSCAPGPQAEAPANDAGEARETPAVEAETLAPASSSEEPAVKQGEESAGTIPAPAVHKKPLPAGTKVLHVGDSFAGALGLPLSKKLEAAGVRSILKHTDASYLTTWAWEGALQDYLWKYNPDLVIVTLGANELGIAQPEQRERTVKKIISTIGERPCVWVAIPLWNGKQNGLMDVIERSVGPCVFMDTNSLIDVAAMPRMSDGIHPTSEARVEWADFVFKWLETHRAGEPKPWTMSVD